VGSGEGDSDRHDVGGRPPIAPHPAEVGRGGHLPAARDGVGRHTAVASSGLRAKLEAAGGEVKG
jgi:hypothetical protein